MTRRKIRKEKREYVIGVDETNNGLKLKFSNPHYQDAVIVTGYLMRDPRRANYGCCKHEGKGWAFGPTRRHQKSLEKGNEYLNSYPNFFYTLINRKMLNTGTPLGVLKAEAITRITLKFLLMNPELNNKNIHVVTDEMDGKDHSRLIHNTLDMYFNRAGLRDVPHKYRSNGDNKVIAIRKADTIGYCLAGIHLFSGSKRWPRATRKIPSNKLDELVEAYYRETDGEYDPEQ